MVGEAAKFIPIVGSIAGGGATFASVRWIGNSVTYAAAAASEEIYAILKQHRLQQPLGGSEEHLAPLRDPVIGGDGPVRNSQEPRLPSQSTDCPRQVHV
jgi:hypothetical protein